MPANHPNSLVELVNGSGKAVSCKVPETIEAAEAFNFLK